MKSLWRKILSHLLLISLFVFFDFSGIAYAEASRLVDARDLVAVNALGAHVLHAISFGLPAGNYPDLVNSDYIMINMDNFSDITLPTYVSGPYTGDPVYSISTKTIGITGIAMAAGEYMTIQGIAATSPTTSVDDMYIHVQICSDASCTTVKYDQGISTSRASNDVTVKAVKTGSVGNLRISGWASPGMFISFFESGTDLGSTMAGNGGYFYQDFRGMPSATHTITLYGTDVGSRITPPVLLQDIVTVEMTEVEVSNVIMPPTITIDKEEINKGETINITGSGVPDYKSIIFTEPPLQTMETQTNVNTGQYQYSFSDTSQLDYGDHKMYSLLQNISGAQSRPSVTLFYRVVSGTEPPPDTGDGTCDISRGNLNCDPNNHVDLADFSILLYYWGSGAKAADINADGSVNLVDFSIMMFYWQG